MAKDPALWQNIVHQIDLKIKDLANCRNDLSKMGENASKYDFTVEELQILNQIKCHILLNGNKLGLKTPLQENLPSEIEIEPYMPFENDDFSKQLQSFLKENKFSEPKTIDFYQSIGCKNLNGGK